MGPGKSSRATWRTRRPPSGTRLPFQVFSTWPGPRSPAWEKSVPERQAFWFRRTFKLQGQTPQVALLKFHKARYGLRAILNGHDLGTHLPCFTPAYFDVKPFLKDDGQDNVLLVRLGANPECLPSDMPRGWDFEKYLFIPGLYDSIELILTGAPFIQNVQIVPDLEKGIARAYVEVAAGDAPAEARLKATVREARSGLPAGVPPSRRPRSP